MDSKLHVPNKWKQLQDVAEKELSELDQKHPGIANIYQELFSPSTDVNVDDLVERKMNWIDNPQQSETMKKSFRDLFHMVRRQMQSKKLILKQKEIEKPITFKKRSNFHANNDLPYHLNVSTSTAQYIIDHTSQKLDLKNVQFTQYCYNCFTPLTNNKTLQCCSICKNAYYCSSQCKKENKKYHQISCSEPCKIAPPPISAKTLYYAINKLRFYFSHLIVDEQLMYLIKYVETGYNMWHNNQIDDSENVLHGLPLENYTPNTFFYDIGLNIHTAVLRYDINKSDYLTYFRQFWSMPGIVEYLLHRTYVSKTLTDLRIKHNINYFDNITDLSQHRKLESECIYRSGDILRQWSWWIFHIFSVSCTHDAFLPKQYRPMSVIDEGRTSLHDISVMPMRDVILCKIVKLFMNIDCLDTLDEAFMPIGCNIMARLMKNRQIAQHLLKNNILNSILFAAWRCKNNDGVIHILKCIKLPDDSAFLNHKHQMELLVSIFNFIQHSQENIRKNQVYGDISLKKTQMSYFDQIWLYVLLHLFGKNELKKLGPKARKSMVSGSRTGKIMLHCLTKYFNTIINMKQVAAYSLADTMFLLSTKHKQMCYYGNKYFDQMFSSKFMIKLLFSPGSNLLCGIFQQIECRLDDIKSKKDNTCDKFKAMIEKHREKAGKDKQKRKIVIPMCSWILCANYKHKKDRQEKGKSKFLQFYRCGKCKETKYCSKFCQKKDWKMGHKSVCIELMKTAQDIQELSQSFGRD